jgi:type IV pilus assembly protein PilE
MKPQAGFTLVETLVVLAMACIFAAVAWPPFQDQLARSRRADAVQALQRLQAAQEQYRTDHGHYASQLSRLPGAATGRSARGLYDIALLDAGVGAYRAAARARADGAQRVDAECAEIVLVVREGFADHAPSRRCWNR